MGKLAGKNYYSGVVDYVEDTRTHKRTTLCTFGTRTSVKCTKENQPPEVHFQRSASFFMHVTSYN